MNQEVAYQNVTGEVSKAKKTFALVGFCSPISKIVIGLYTPVQFWVYFQSSAEQKNALHLVCYGEVCYL